MGRGTLLFDTSLKCFIFSMSPLTSAVHNIRLLCFDPSKEQFLLGGEGKVL